MNDNLKEAFKELEHLDVCPAGKKTIKKILCKVVGEEYNEQEMKEIETLRFYEASNKDRDDKQIFIKVPKDTEYIFIENGMIGISYLTSGKTDWVRETYDIKRIHGDNDKVLSILETK